MIGSTWNVLFVAVAMGAGMFAQQAAHKVSAASEDKQVNSLVGLELFCSAEGFYLAGRFNGSPPAAPLSAASPASPESPPTDEPLLVAANDPPPDESMQPSEPAPGPADSELAASDAAIPDPAAPDPAAPELAAAAAADAPVVLAAPEPPAPEASPAPDALAGADSNEPAAEMPEVAAPEPVGEALATDPAAEVLPPPAPDVEPRMPGDNFGKFADDPSAVVPPRSSIRPPLPAGMNAPAGRTYLDAPAGQASRYVSPADLVRDRAVARGEQRRQRIETRKWLGISPLRPAVDSTPFTTVEQPAQLLLVVPDASTTVHR